MNDEPVSRTQKKRADRALQKLGEALASLAPDQINAMEMPQELRQALHFVRKTTSHGARRRQMQYIGALMRQLDPEPLQQALDQIRLGDIQASARFKQVERWRDALLAGEDSLVEEILAACPAADRQRLTQLIRNARKGAGDPSRTKPARTLFRYLKEIADEADQG